MPAQSGETQLAQSAAKGMSSLAMDLAVYRKIFFFFYT